MLIVENGILFLSSEFLNWHLKFDIVRHCLSITESLHNYSIQCMQKTLE